jgi:hypothetical protein
MVGANFTTKLYADNTGNLVVTSQSVSNPETPPLQTTVSNGAITIENVTGTSLTASTSPAITTSTYFTYYNITNSGFNALTLPASIPTDAGFFWVLRNNTSSYLSITVTNNANVTTPTSIPPSNSLTIAVSGTGSSTDGYVLF